MADEFGDKTEQPTDRRRSEVREKGNVARSVDLNVAASVLAATCALHFFGPDLASSLGSLLKSSLSEPAWTRIELPQLAARGWVLAGLVAQALAPTLALMFLSSVFINFAQVGVLLSPEAALPNFSRINPWEGVKRIVSVQGLVKLAVSILKLTMLGLIAWNCLASTLPRALVATDLDAAGLSREIGSSMVTLGFRFSVAVVILALADYGFQLWKFEQDIRMTKEEVREEMKDMDGDPHIRQRRKEAHRKLTQSRQMQAVPTADVVITNPTEIAVAIKYDEKKLDAPIVVAKGQGLIAARIRQLAVQNAVPIVEKKPLARALYRDVKVGQAIPVEFYEAVAEILAYVYRLSNKAPRSRR